MLAEIWLFKQNYENKLFASILSKWNRPIRKPCREELLNFDQFYSTVIAYTCHKMAVNYCFSRATRGSQSNTVIAQQLHKTALKMCKLGNLQTPNHTGSFELSSQTPGLPSNLPFMPACWARSENAGRGGPLLISSGGSCYSTYLLWRGLSGADRKGWWSLSKGAQKNPSWRMHSVANTCTSLVGTARLKTNFTPQKSYKDN